MEKLRAQLVALLAIFILIGCKAKDQWEYTKLSYYGEIDIMNPASLVLNRSEGDKVFRVSSIEGAMSEMGKFGWQLVTVEQEQYCKTYTFKRTPREKEGYWILSVPKSKKPNSP